MTTVVDHLLALIRIPSVSSLSNRPVIAYAQQALHAAGWTTTEQVHRGEDGLEKVNMIAAPAGQAPLTDADLAFVCHTDTVPYALDWPAAVSPLLSDSAVHGCGACDVKGFLACLITAVAQVRSPHQVRIVLTADEEVGCLGAHRLLATGGLRARHMVIGEPTSLQPARAGKGYCVAEVTVLGAEAHSAHPQQGRSAILDAARLIREIEQYARSLEAEQNGFFNPAFTTLNIGTIHGGTAKNVVPGECRFLVEWRPIPGQPADAVPAALAAMVERLRHDDPAFRCSVQVLRQQSGFETPADSALVRAMESLTGHSSIAIAFGSEASVLNALADHVVVWGPGDMRTAHSPRECVPVRELEQAVACIGALLQSPAL